MQTGETRTCKIKRTPAQGSAAWIGSYWTALSPICLKRSIYTTEEVSYNDRLAIAAWSGESPYFLDALLPRLFRKYLQVGQDTEIVVTVEIGVLLINFVQTFQRRSP